MKKILLILVSLVLISTIAIYVFIPNQLTVSSALIVHATENGTQRFLLDETKWHTWWKDPNSNTTKENITSNGTFRKMGNAFSISEKFYKSAKINIEHNAEKYVSEIAIIPIQLDSTGIEWKFSFALPMNPIDRVSKYLDAKNTKKSMDEVLSMLQGFAGNTDNVYGIHIEKTSTNDTLLVSSKVIMNTYPTTKNIYDLINNIKGYLLQNNAKQTGSPIFNITVTEEKTFQLMAAIPTDKVIPSKVGFSSKKMIKGSFMVADVVGGDSTIKKASISLQQYFIDYRKTSMAMNYTMLITDRIYQPDSTKWITRLYAPVY